MKEALSLKLNYMKQENNEDNHHYDLVYLPVFNEDPFSFLDANTGEWNSLYGEKIHLSFHILGQKRNSIILLMLKF